jgi:hypothetical protein
LAGIALSRMPPHERDRTLGNLRAALGSLVNDLEALRTDNDMIATCREAKTSLLH